MTEFAQVLLPVLLLVAGAAPATCRPQPADQQPSNLDQAQVQRGLGQLAAELGGQVRQAASGNVLEVLANVGKAFQQQVAPNKSDAPAPINAIAIENANNNNNTLSHREQGELLRQEIARRVGHLQQVVAGPMEALRTGGDAIVRRLLEQLNGRLELAKSKADKVINGEPANGELGVKALATINQGLNSLNHVITNVVGRLELASRAGAASNPVQRHLLENAAKLRVNLQQIGSALANQQAAQLPNQQQQQQQQSPVKAVAL